MTRRISVRAIIQQQDKLLLVRLKPYNKERTADFWCTVGGGLDEDESLVDGLKREVVEETGVIPSVGRLLYIQQYGDKDSDSLEFFFEVTNADDFLEIDLSKTTHGSKEIAEIAFVDPRSVDVLPVFLKDHCTEDHSQVVISSYIA